MSKYVAEFEPTVDPDLPFDGQVIPSDEVDAFSFSNAVGRSGEDIDAEIAEMEADLMSDPDPAPEAEEKKTGAVNALAAQLRIAERERAEMKAIIGEAKARSKAAKRAQDAEARAAAEAIPSAEENPQGHIIGSLKKIQGRLDRDQTLQDNADRSRLKKDEMAAATRKAAKFAGEVGQDEYDSALGHLFKSIATELAEESPGASQNDIADRMRGDLAKKMVDWNNKKRNPGKRLYAMAKARGYKPGTGNDTRAALDAQTEEKQAGKVLRKEWQASDSEGLPEPRRGTRQRDRGRAEVASTRRRASNNPRSIAAVPGAGPTGKVTARYLATLSEAEYDEAASGKRLRDLLADKAIE